MIHLWSLRSIRFADGMMSMSTLERRPLKPSSQAFSFDRQMLSANTCLTSRSTHVNHKFVFPELLPARASTLFFITVRPTLVIH